MDAKMGEWVVTPRRGKPVEINALWHNALGFTAELIDAHGEEGAGELRELANKARRSFNEQFWYSEGGYCHDVVTDDGKDPSLRPNQLYALSLPRRLLEGDRAKSVMQAVERELYTPVGLRSLAPSSPGFMARYEGDLVRRDGAYHQGAVWGFLIGPYVTAYLNTFGRTSETKDRVRQMLQPFREHLTVAGLGTVSEIFDGDTPHRPAGCISQAWSVAELLRVIYEELDGRP
jgi:predicted glycogen debranching enzyme